MFRSQSRVFMTVMTLLLAVLTAACTQAGALNIAYPVVTSPLPLTRVTGADMPQTTRFGVYGTDLGIPFLLANGSIGYLFGDTFTSANADDIHGGQDWRSPVLLRSNQMPEVERPIEFDSAAGLAGSGIAPEIMPNGHRTGGEFTVIPTDAISFPETGDTIVSYMSINDWSTDTDNPAWTTNHAGLAWSPDGNRFYRIGPIWRETPERDSLFQVWSMQRDGDFVYVASVQAGRRPSTDGRMVLMRVPWDRMLDPAAYHCWDGSAWSDSCAPILHGGFGEPSLRLLQGGTWAMSYLDTTQPDRTQIVTRYASAPMGPWSDPKVQVTWNQLPRLYGGFIHPWSTKDRLILMVSTHQPHARYDVSVFIGKL